MKSGLLIRSSPSWIPTSPAKASTPSSYHDSVTGILFPGNNNNNASTRSNNSLHLEINNIVSSRKRNKYSMIRRAETDMFSTIKKKNYGSGLSSSGSDDGRRTGTKVDDLSDDQTKIGDYYLEMLKSNPGDPLLLRNYGKFVYEVEGDVAKAEEYYSRAILASSPSGPDGEVLCLYGKLIWETQKHRSRADSYFRRAVQVAPSDCFVMGAYAHFLWVAEEDDEEEELADKI